MGFLMREKILTEKLTSTFINNDLINDLCKIIDKDDINGVVKTLKSNFLTQGDLVNKFENSLNNYFGSNSLIKMILNLIKNQK